MTINHLSTKLTRKILLAAPAGAYLASNLMVDRHHPVFAEVVGSTLQDRSEQWSRIRAVGADHRLCRVFATEDEFSAWLTGITDPE